MGRKIIGYKTNFVEFIPKQLEPDILYISVKYNVGAHLCACGCGKEVITPLDRKNGWIMIYDGENVSLMPSIGNGRYECCSHYFLKRGLVEWLPKFKECYIGESQGERTWFEKFISRVKKCFSN